VEWEILIPMSRPTHSLQSGFVLDGELEQAIAAMDSQLCADVRAVVFYGPLADEKGLCDVLAGFGFGDEFSELFAPKAKGYPEGKGWWSRKNDWFVARS